MGVLNLTDPESTVKLQPRIIPINEEQKWQRGTANEFGWFQLTNPCTGKVLTAVKGYLGYGTQIHGN